MADERPNHDGRAPHVLEPSNTISSQHTQQNQMKEYMDRVEERFLSMKNEITVARVNGLYDASAVFNLDHDLTHLLYIRACIDERRGDRPFFVPNSNGEVFDHDSGNASMFVGTDDRVHLYNPPVPVPGHAQYNPTATEDINVVQIVSMMLAVYEGQPLPAKTREHVLEMLRMSGSELADHLERIQQRRKRTASTALDNSSNTTRPSSTSSPLQLAQSYVDEASHGNNTRSSPVRDTNIRSIAAISEKNETRPHRKMKTPVSFAEVLRDPGTQTDTPHSKAVSLSASSNPPIPAFSEHPLFAQPRGAKLLTQRDPFRNSGPGLDSEVSGKPTESVSTVATRVPRHPRFHVQWQPLNTVETMRDTATYKRAGEVIPGPQLDKDEGADHDSDTDAPDVEPLIENFARRHIHTAQSCASKKTSRPALRPSTSTAGRNTFSATVPQSSAPAQRSATKLATKAPNSADNSTRTQLGPPATLQTPNTASSVSKIANPSHLGNGIYRDNKGIIYGPNGFETLHPLPRFQANGIDQSAKLVIQYYKNDRNGTRKLWTHHYMPRSQEMRNIDWSSKHHILNLNRWPNQVVGRNGALPARDDMRARMWTVEEEEFLKGLAEKYADDEDVTREKLFEMFNEWFGGQEREVTLPTGKKVVRKLVRSTETLSAFVTRSGAFACLKGKKNFRPAKKTKKEGAVDGNTTSTMSKALSETVKEVAEEAVRSVLKDVEEYTMEDGEDGYGEDLIDGQASNVQGEDVSMDDSKVEVELDSDVHDSTMADGVAEQIEHQ